MLLLIFCCKCDHGPPAATEATRLLRYLLLLHPSGFASGGQQPCQCGDMPLAALVLIFAFLLFPFIYWFFLLVLTDLLCFVEKTTCLVWRRNACHTELGPALSTNKKHLKEPWSQVPCGTMSVWNPGFWVWIRLFFFRGSIPYNTLWKMIRYWKYIDSNKNKTHHVHFQKTKFEQKQYQKQHHKKSYFHVFSSFIARPQRGSLLLWFWAKCLEAPWANRLFKIFISLALLQILRQHPNLLLEMLCLLGLGFVFCVSQTVFVVCGFSWLSSGFAMQIQLGLFGA